MLTEVTPRHWPRELRERSNIPWSVPGEDRKNATTASSGFKLDGESIDRDALMARCKKSFTDFLAIRDRLKAENDRFYEPTVTEEVVRHHISTARSDKDLAMIREFLDASDEWTWSKAFGELGERFAAHGRWDAAIGCFGAAYLQARTWQVTDEGLELLRAIGDRDRSEAESYLMQKTYRSATGTSGSYCTPCVAAGGLNLLNRTDELDAVFEDFLRHCEGMFAQLPDGEDYRWIAEGTGQAWDEERAILEFCVAHLETPDIDQGKRLVRGLVRLAVRRPSTVVPALVASSLSATGRSRQRLLMILDTLAAREPGFVKEHQRKLIGLFKPRDYFCRTVALRIFSAIKRDGGLENVVGAQVRSLETKYSSHVFHRGFRVCGAPTREFEKFFKRHTLFEFPARVELVERILGAPSGSCVAAIERRLRAEGWSIKEERLRVRDDWEGHVHPQGWPTVWITTSFQEAATTALAWVLDEVLEKSRCTAEERRWLWMATQAVDPEYVARGPARRPEDISALGVSDAAGWLKELEDSEAFRLASGSDEDEDDQWISLFEARVLSQEEKYSVPYVQDILRRPGLIPRDVYGSADAVERLAVETGRFLLSKAMAITAEQFRCWMGDERGVPPNDGDGWVSPIVVHRNPSSFYGYPEVCSLAPFVVKEFDLSFDGLGLVRGDEVVCKYEVWQEGYRDDAYSREMLSSGVRFRVRRAFVSEICRRYRRLLCIRIDERRQHFASRHDKAAKSERDLRRYVLHHMG